MDRFLKNWIDETIDNDQKPMRIKKFRIRIRELIYALIANHRAPAWVQSPSKKMDLR
ncbi:MAG: hypothetical protein QGI73_02220 [Candidatus Thalassarchaeaceae archaeon]|jgi:hypothetical protein|nr:hypothetical protein [Candidatus Thalassarchaeaceae archaeon]